LAREGVDLPTISGIDLVFFDSVWRYKKEKKELFFTHFYNKYFTHYIGIDGQELGRFIYNKYFNSPAQIKKYYKEGNKFIEIIKKQDKKKNILTLFREFRRQFKKVNYLYSITSWLGIEAWQNDFDNILSEIIKRNKLEKNREQIIASAYIPWKKTALLEIQDKIRKSSSSSKRLAKEYQFLRSWSVVWYRPIDEKWINTLGKRQAGAEIELLPQKKLINLLKPSQNEKQFLKLAPYIIFFKDWRDEVRRKHCYYWTFLFDKIAKHFEIEYNDLGYLTLDEIEESLKKNHLNKKSIKKRKENEVIITSENNELKIKVIDKNIPQRYKEIMKRVWQSEKTTVVNGIIAQRGEVKGKAVIVRSFHDLKKVNKGDVLIANTTHPNHLPGMQRAAAFVTNEGGMLSHAAIIAREMKKPCIVGTKIATKIFKDGDLVEVDANKGVVKKIK